MFGGEGGGVWDGRKIFSVLERGAYGGFRVVFIRGRGSVGLV